MSKTKDLGCERMTLPFFFFLVEMAHYYHA